MAETTGSQQWQPCALAMSLPRVRALETTHCIPNLLYSAFWTFFLFSPCCRFLCLFHELYAESAILSALVRFLFSPSSVFVLVQELCAKAALLSICSLLRSLLFSLFASACAVSDGLHAKSDILHTFLTSSSRLLLSSPLVPAPRVVCQICYIQHVAHFLFSPSFPLFVPLLLFRLQRRVSALVAGAGPSQGSSASHDHSRGWLCQRSCFQQRRYHAGRRHGPGVLTRERRSTNRD